MARPTKCAAILVCTVMHVVALSNDLLSQHIVKTFHKDSAALYLKDTDTAKYKIIPEMFKDVIRIALLYYPELSATRIEFRIKKAKAPLAARPTIGGILRRPSKRKYIITISNKTTDKTSPIRLKNLGFNAQVGVIGHELAHISQYNSKRFFYFIGLAIQHLSGRSMDKFENQTDRRCIEHGLGYQLLSWSEEVRKRLSRESWAGVNNSGRKRERYMNPGTIIKVMESLPRYK
jgi:hypothetical protein